MDWFNLHAADKAGVYDGDGVLLFPVKSGPQPAHS